MAGSAADSCSVCVDHQPGTARYGESLCGCDCPRGPERFVRSTELFAVGKSYGCDIKAIFDRSCCLAKQLDQPCSDGFNERPSIVTNSPLDHLPLAGTLVGDHFDGWSADVRADFASNEFNGQVGTTLVFENDRVRVWDLTLAPGQRVAAHRHVLDYFWVAVEPGRSRQHTHDGTTREVVYEAGEARFYRFGEGEYLLHDLENIGTTPLKFHTVELMSSTNPPIVLHA